MPLFMRCAKPKPGGLINTPHFILNGIHATFTIEYRAHAHLNDFRIGNHIRKGQHLGTGISRLFAYA